MERSGAGLKIIKRREKKEKGTVNTWLKSFFLV